MVGSVSGGCIEGAVVKEALDAIRDGKPRLLDFGVTDEQAWDVGLACGGKVQVFVEKVDMVCGVGYDHAAGARYHRIPRVVSDLGVFDFATPDRSMRLASLHPGVTSEQVREATSFELAVPDDVPRTRPPTAEELRLIREVIDPGNTRAREVGA